MINFYTFVLQNITATAKREKELKDAFAKQIGWMEKIDDPENPEEEIDNPVSFQEAFNESIWQYLRQTCVAGMQKIKKETAKADDTFEDLIV